MDTTHEYRSIECEAWCYEWAGSNTIYVSRKDGDTVECFSAGSAGTHCSLHLLIVKEHCLASIKVISIAFDGNASYPCKSGFIRIDRGLFARDILKGEFDMQFKHEENPVQKMFWKGKIYAKMAKK